MLWQIRSAPVPALVGTIPSKQAELIQLFDNSTITSHFGGSGSGIDYRAQSGLRLEAGLWLDEDRQYALEGSCFQLGQGRQQFQAASKGGDVLGPIFFRDSLAGQEVLIMEAVPGLRAGEMTIEATQHLWGAEANVFRRLAVGNVLDYLDLSVSSRHLQFSEGLRIQGTSQTILGGHLPCG